MKIITKYNFGDSVYVVSDPDQWRRQVVELKIIPPQTIIYICMCGDESSAHYDFELTDEQDLVTKTSN